MLDDISKFIESEISKIVSNTKKDTSVIKNITLKKADFTGYLSAYDSVTKSSIILLKNDIFIMPKQVTNQYAIKVKISQFPDDIRKALIDIIFVKKMKRVNAKTSPTGIIFKVVDSLMGQNVREYISVLDTINSTELEITEKELLMSLNRKT